MSTVDSPQIRNKRIVITGGAGFIGSHLAEALVVDNEVVVVDNLSTGNIDHVPSAAEFIEADIRDRQLMAMVLEDADLLFHEAAIVSVEQSVDDPEQTQEVNATATLQLLSLARELSVRVVFASSAAVYGQPESIPISESEPTASSSPYGLAKLTADQYVKLYADLYDVEAIALRYFNIYGPRQTGGDYSGVIDVFLQQAHSGGPITVHGDGTQTRDFIHVDDVVQANLRAAAYGEPGMAYNIGTGESISILELATLIREITGNTESVDIEHISARDGDIEQSRADIQRAKTDLGFDPTIRLPDGLQELI